MFGFSRDKGALPLACLAFAATLLTSCVTQPPRIMPPGTLPVVGTMPVEIYAGQQELMVEAQQTNAMAAGGGLLGALIVAAIDNTAAKNDERRVGPIRNALVGTDLSAFAARSIQDGLDRTALASTVEIEILPETLAARLSRNGMSARNHVLTISPTYALTSDLRVMKVQLVAEYSDRTMEGRKITSQPLYVSTMQYLVPLPGDSPGMKEDERATHWTALGRDRLQSMIQDGYRSTVTMLNFDLTQQGSTIHGLQVDYALGASAAGKGEVAHEDGDRRWIRAISGQLVSIPK